MLPSTDEILKCKKHTILVDKYCPPTPPRAQWVVKLVLTIDVYEVQTTQNRPTVIPRVRLLAQFDIHPSVILLLFDLVRSCSPSLQAYTTYPCKAWTEKNELNIMKHNQHNSCPLCYLTSKHVRRNNLHSGRRSRRPTRQMVGQITEPSARSSLGEVWKRTGSLKEIGRSLDEPSVYERHTVYHVSHGSQEVS